MAPVYQIIEISVDADGNEGDRPGPSTRARRASIASTTYSLAVSWEGSIKRRAIGCARR